MPRITRITRMLGSSLAVLIAAGGMAPAANASPLGRLLHLHPHAAEAHDARITVLVYNKGQIFQDVKVDGRTYTVLPHRWLAIKAPVGTAVYADTPGIGHRKGDMLFGVTRDMKDATVSFE